MITVNDYYQKVGMYKNLKVNEFKKVFDFLCEANNVMKMLVSNDVFGKSALEGVVQELESKFPDLFFKDVEKNCVGSMIKFILGHFGYVNITGKPIQCKSKFKGAAHYEKRESAEYTLICKIEKA